MENNAYPDYREYEFLLETDPDMESETAEILIAELSVLGFESFSEEDGKVFAYIREADLTEETEESIATLGYAKSYSFKKIPGQNWNAVWESNFEPIEIPGRCRIRADFHEPDSSFPLEIVVTPKMSFGTGHHSTTRLMMEAILDMNLSGKRILDMGCGTGILAILAGKMGSSDITAIDNDPQCIINTRENFDENQIISSQLYLLGEEPVLEKFDLILANIQRNVLLEQISWYADHLKSGGKLLVSGIHEDSVADLTKAGARSGLKFDYFKALNGWVMMAFDRL